MRSQVGYRRGIRGWQNAADKATDAARLESSAGGVPLKAAAVSEGSSNFRAPDQGSQGLFPNDIIDDLSSGFDGLVAGPFVAGRRGWADAECRLS